MGGFLSGLGTLLGGFNTKRRIDAEGFDFREKQAQEEFDRQKAREQYGTQLATDYLTSAEQPDEGVAAQAFGPDVDRTRKQLLIGAAAGRAKQSRSALEEQKAFNTRMLRADQDASAMERERFKAQARQDLLAQAEEIRQNQKLSPRERESKLLDLERTMAQIEAMDRRFSKALSVRDQPKPRLMSVFDPAKRANVYKWISPGEESEYEPGRPATMVQTQGMADAIVKNVNRLEELANKPDPITSGPFAGRFHPTKGTIAQDILGPSGAEGEFDTIARELVDLVYVKSGKQINQQEQETLKKIIATRTRGNLPEQVRLLKDYAKTLLQKYGTYEGEFDAPAGRSGGGIDPEVERRLRALGY